MKIVIWVDKNQLSRLHKFLNGNDDTEQVGIYWLQFPKSLESGDNCVLYVQVELSYENYEKFKNKFSSRDIIEDLI